MVKLHLELEGDVGEVLWVLRHIGGGDIEGGEVQDGQSPAPTEGRTSAVRVVPETGTTGTTATLVPGHWTQELAADFMAGLGIVDGQILWHVWRAGAAGIHRSALCRRTDLVPRELRSLLIQISHAVRRFGRQRGLVLSRPVVSNSPLQSYFVDPDFAAVADSLGTGVRPNGAFYGGCEANMRQEKSMEREPLTNTLTSGAIMHRLR